MQGKEKNEGKQPPWLKKEGEEDNEKEEVNEFRQGSISDKKEGEEAPKIALPDGTFTIVTDGRILATWGGPGRGSGQFDWVHGVAVDTLGAVYAADTYGQRVQKFVPVGSP